MKKSVKRKKSFSKVPTIALGPSLPGPKPVPARIGYAKLVIGADGTLEAPTLIDVNTGDSISWLVTNDSERAAKVKNKQFKKGHAALTPIRFTNERVDVPAGGSAAITGVVTHLPTSESDHIKYTVEVRGKRNADYDPDLIIRRPPV